jgi:hypothetical protein
MPVTTVLPEIAQGPVPSRQAIEAAITRLLPLVDLPQPAVGRPPQVAPALLWAAIFVSILEGTPTQRAIWTRISGAGLWSYAPVPVTAEAVRKRLVGLDPATFEALFVQCTALLTAEWAGDQTLAPFAAGVFAIDDTTLDKLVRSVATPAGPARPLAGRLHTVFDVRRQCFRAVLPTDRAGENERVAVRDLVAALPRGSLVLLDRGYLSFALYDDLTDAETWFVTRLREAITFTTTHVLTDAEGVTDELGFLGRYRADRGKHLLRRITITTPGEPEPFRFLTNVTDPAVLSPDQIVHLYSRRWDIETAFSLLKRDLGLHLIWSTSWAMVQLQIWATLIIAQIVFVLRLQVALRAGVDLFDVSVGVLIRELPPYLARGYADVIGAIVARGRYGGIIRPSRRKRRQIPINLRVIPPPPGLPRTQHPRYARKA